MNYNDMNKTNNTTDKVDLSTSAFDTATSPVDIDSIFRNAGEGVDKKRETSKFDMDGDQIDDFARNLGAEYIKNGHELKPENKPPYPLGYRVPRPTYSYGMQPYRRFMDTSYDEFNIAPLKPWNMGYIDTDAEKKYKQEVERITRIKNTLTVTEWDILNGTNFMSSTDQIKAFLEIIKKLGNAGIFNI